jgi:hypothetical protein
MKKITKTPDPITIDLSKSVGYQLYCLPRIWHHASDSYPYAETFYALHRRSIRCPIYERRKIIPKIDEI